MSETSNQQLQGMSYTSDQPLQGMSDTSNQPLQEMFETSNPPLREMSDTSSQLDSSEQSIPSYNHPCGDLLDEGRRRDFINICLPLYQASVIGDWEAVENILAINHDFRDDLLGYSITEDKDTTLTIVVSFQSIKFVENLVDRMTDQQLALQDKHGQTALHYAAAVGNIDMARTMVGKHPQLLKIRNGLKALPILMATLYGKHDMVAYLYDEYKSMAGDDWTVHDISNVFWRCIEADLFDCALRISDDQNNQRGFPSEEYAREILYILAQKTHAFKDIKSWKNSRMKAKSPHEDELFFKCNVNGYGLREEKNNASRTPLQLFTQNHQDMVSKGEKWMKETANQCMVVAALITTVVFSAAFTIPGGYDQNDGLPIFLKDGPFIAFVILDAVSLILSSASILMFLSILTSRYAQEDFLISLPKKLMIGLTTLFLSIIAMMVAFAVSFFVLYRNKLISIPIIISVGAVVPIFLYMKLQFPLLVDAYRSTYGSRYLFRPKKRVLYYRNPNF